MQNNPKWLNDVVIYFDILVETNNQLLKLIALNCCNDNECILMQKLYINISQNIVRLIPCKCSDKTKKVEMLHEGILNLQDNFDYLCLGLKQLCDKYNSELYYIKFIRNKTEHNPHALIPKSMISGNSDSTIYFEYSNKENGVTHKIEVSVQYFIKIIKELNTIFSKIQNEIKLYQNSLENAKQNHPYFYNVLYLDFNEYNKIYNSNELFLISKIINKIE